MEIEMFNYQPLQWLFLFFFYSFLGWCFESTYVSISEKRLVNRGFIRGPFLPLYGSGGIMMLVASRPYYDNILLVFIAGCIGATALELVTGVLMEALFKVRYWEYFHKKFNYKGYICLESSLVWGFFTVVFSHFLHPPIERIITGIPYNILSVVTMVVTVAFTFDFAMAFRTAMDLRDVLIYMENLKAEMRRMQKRLDVLVAFKGEDVREGIGARIDGISSGIGNRIDGISSGIGNRVDALSSSLEKTFGVFKDKVRINPTAYVSSVREEVSELYVRYKVMMSRITPHPVKNFMEWYRERTIYGNPTMTSKDYAASFEEVKEMTRKAKGMKEDKES